MLHLGLIKVRNNAINKSGHNKYSPAIINRINQKSGTVILSLVEEKDGRLVVGEDTYQVDVSHLWKMKTKMATALQKKLNKKETTTLVPATPPPVVSPVVSERFEPCMAHVMYCHTAEEYRFKEDLWLQKLCDPQTQFDGRMEWLTVCHEPKKACSLGIQHVLADFALTTTTLLRFGFGSIVDFKGDAIVNAANPNLYPGGGIDGAIRATAGSELNEACFNIQPTQNDVRCPVGKAVITVAGGLPCKKVIHAVGPNFNNTYANPKSLAKAYKSALICARENGVRTLAFCPISGGIFRGPKTLLYIVQVALKSIAYNIYPELEEVYFCAYTGAERKILEDIANAHKPVWSTQP